MTAAPSTQRIRGSVTLVRLHGVPIRAHWSLVLGLPFFAWLMTLQYFGSTPAGWAWGTALAVALFASVTAHELAHSIVALRLGTGIREIILLPIGGASIMASPPRDPRSEFLIAIVGPLTSLVLGSAILGAALLVGIPLTFPSAVPHAPAFLLAAGYLNVTLGLFNLLIPAFPMDGGRVLRAILAGRLGVTRATVISARIGRGLALAMGLGGLLLTNVFLIVIAVFVWSGATAEERFVRVTSALEGVHVEDIMSPHPAAIAPDASLSQALNMMLETKHVVLPVVEDGRALSVITSDDIAAVPPAERDFVTVRAVARRPVVTRSLHEDAGAVVATVLETGMVAVVDASQRLLGIITPTDVLRTVQLAGIADGTTGARG